MIKLVKVCVGYTAYKTDATVSDKKNIIAENIDGYTIMKDQKKEMFVKKGKYYFNIMDIGKFRLSKKNRLSLAYPILPSAKLDKIIPGKDTIIEETLKPIDLSEEVSMISDNNVRRYFLNNLDSTRVSLPMLKKLNKVIK